MPNNPAIQFSVFTKPWRTPLPDLARFVGGLGFDGIELPVRPGFQVEPEHIARDLPQAVRLLADFGLTITSVAGTTDAATIAACAECRVPLLRTMVPVGPEGYLAAEARARREYDALLPLLESSGVMVGVQNHSGRYVCHALGLRRLLDGYDPRHVGAVWDAAHTALNGEEPELALEIIWPQLALVNLKNAFWRPVSGPETTPTEWEAYWTDGRHGLASWPRVAAELGRRGYVGTVCLTAEYTDEHSVDRLIAEDLAFARSLLTN
jgi:sugar phosphate isomerase/epimerase